MRASILLGGIALTGLSATGAVYSFGYALSVGFSSIGGGRPSSSGYGGYAQIMIIICAVLTLIGIGTAVAGLVADPVKKNATPPETQEPPTASIQATTK